VDIKIKVMTTEKTIALALTLFIPLAFAACGNGTTNTSNTETPSVPAVPENNLRFIVISDTHFGNSAGKGPVTKVSQALKNLTGKTPKADAIFVAGDITNDGKTRQYEQLLSVFNNKANLPDSLPVYFMMGNHDNFVGASAASEYMSKIKQPLHQYLIIKNYPFIAISETGPNENDFDDVAVKFLADNLATATKDCPGKPVFVFIHVPTINTTYGSWVSGPLADGGWCTDRFKATLDKYPQAVVFSGHTHYPLGDPRSIHQERFTAINTSSTTYSEVEGNIGLTAGTLPDGYENITEGVIVNVKENGDLEIERWDTYRNEEITPRWLIRAPHDGTNFTYKGRTGGTAPTFNDGDKPLVDNITAKACKVSFPQASDDELVHHYKIEIMNGDKLVSKHVVFSGFYLNSSMPDTLTVTLNDLSAQTLYTAKVTAYDSYRQASPAIDTVFQTVE
jgi:predicted phosphodiesterase